MGIGALKEDALFRRAGVAGALLALLSGIMLSVASGRGPASPPIPLHAGNVVRVPVGGAAAEPLGRPRLHTRFLPGQVELRYARAVLSLRFSGVGYGGPGSLAGSANPAYTGGRVVYAHGAVREWYAKRRAGLEQGFTIARAPAGRPSQPLTVSLVASGDVHPHLVGAGRTIRFAGPGGAVLSYGSLHVTDARGRVLHSWLELERGRVLLRVRARGARFPLRIDPLVQQGGKLTGQEEDGAGLFGFSVSLSGDGSTALVGGPADGGFGGAAWVLVRSGGTWTQQGPKLTAGESTTTAIDCAAGAGEESEECGFGRNVALSADGNTAVVGGPRESGPCRSSSGEPRECRNQGAVWVFTRSGSSWSLQAKLSGGPEEGVEGRFGRSVAVSSDGATILVGAPSDSGGHGAAWVFTRSGSSWVQQGPKLTGGSEEQGEGHLGGSVALSGEGDAALVGAPGDEGYAGAAWMFRRAGSSWVQQGPKLTGGAEEQGVGHFGFSAALSADGSTAILGARNDAGRAGAAFVFTCASACVQQGSKLRGVSEIGEGEFGYSVALSANGGTALVGGPGDEGHEGSAWLFTRSGSAWIAQPEKLAGAEESGKAWFGAAVALSADGSAAMFGGPHDNASVGAAWAFEETSAPTAAPAVSGVSPSSGPSAGGTTVEIKGSNFTSASAVRFGAASAAYRVISANLLRAVSPAGKGTVDVTVTSPAGTSAVSSKDRFTFESTKGGEVPHETVTPRGETVTMLGEAGTLMPAGNPGPSAATGVLQSSATNCRVALVTRKVALVSHGRAAIRLAGKGAGTCRGRLTLQVRRGRGRHAWKQVIGATPFSIAAGTPGTVRVKLNAGGRSLLKASRGHLGAILLLVNQSAAGRQATVAHVRLAPASSRRLALR